MSIRMNVVNSKVSVGSPLHRFVMSQVKLMQPDNVIWCDGSQREMQEIIQIGVRKEKINDKPIFMPLNDETYPNSFHHPSHPKDVARVAERTWVCHNDKKMTGPNNNWMDPAEATAMLTRISTGAMKGKTMYVLPFTMGDPRSPHAKDSVMVTDVSYVAASMGIMTRMSEDVYARIGNSTNFIPGVHTVADLDPEERYIVHFPDAEPGEPMIWSVNSGYGGNALLGKKCLALRIALNLAYKQGWMAEHMVIMGIENLETGKITYVTVAMPSACGKTNLAMLRPSIPGYKIHTYGDDIAWLYVNEETGELMAINPEYGYFGVAPGTSYDTNPAMMETLKGRPGIPTFYTNTAFNPDTMEPWWDGMDGPVPERLIDWLGNEIDTSDQAALKVAAHPNSRFTAPFPHTPGVDINSNEVIHGVPISAMFFGSRRATNVPLVSQARDWVHGVFKAASIASEATAAEDGAVGVLKMDPMAMRPFNAINLGYYLQHWLNMGERLGEHAPAIFNVNWFMKCGEGDFIWPGFGDNMRVLEWALKRIEGKVDARETPIGYLPKLGGINTEGLDVTRSDMAKLLGFDVRGWGPEAAQIRNYFEQFSGMPVPIMQELEKLEKETA